MVDHSCDSLFPQVVMIAGVPGGGWLGGGGGGGVDKLAIDAERTGFYCGVGLDAGIDDRAALIADKPVGIDDQ